MSEIPAEILEFNELLDAEARPVAEVLLTVIAAEVPDAESKVWHAHPVWFFDGNPVVGYSRLKNCVRLMFWSGQAFETPGLEQTGTFKAAEARYTDADQIDEALLKRWLAEAREKQWNYRDIRKNRGLVPLVGVA